ncbi:MAG: hypothetical protein HPY66_2165 [Firmicutes bacterium]|nr:hypothetical protein [Bacillota bacterium]MDI6706757.1 sigma 54-interacting transcriptional regulator [Bacillota bacterium]
MKDIISRYIKHDAKGEFCLSGETQVIKDGFELMSGAVMNADGYIFLLDGERRVVSGYDAAEGILMENIAGAALDLHPDDSKAQQTIELYGEDGQAAETRLYFYKPGKSDGLDKEYYLGTVLLKDCSESFAFDTLARIFGGMIKYWENTRKYGDEYNFLLRCLDAVDEGISVVDEAGRLVFVNNSCCRIIDIPREELIGKRIDILSRTKPLLTEVLKGGKSIIDVEYFLNVRNKMVHLINSGYPVFDENGGIKGAIDIFRGIERSTKLASTIAGYQASFKFSDIVGQSSIIKEKIRLAKIFAASSENILIQGESGTGKELFAQSIHNHSHRRSEPFIAINCANFPNELIDSELFGYEEGAFTGAQKGGRQGKFELANGGTIFLDEIGEMQLHLQAKLLRVVETKSITRIGGNRPINVDVRIIAATNRDLEDMVNSGKFRKDLYYRLRVHYIGIPSLKERKEDILVLAEHFVKKLNRKMQKNVKGIEAEAKEILINHDWPGNLRELENTIASALFICEGDYITKQHLKMESMVGMDDSAIMNKSLLKRVNRQMVLDALKHTRGNKKKAAELLGVSRPTIYRILKG